MFGVTAGVVEPNALPAGCVPAIAAKGLLVAGLEAPKEKAGAEPDAAAELADPKLNPPAEAGFSASLTSGFEAPKAKAPEAGLLVDVLLPNANG